jgi:hypothetical protein
MNTYWGEPGPNSYAKLEFFGTGGAYAQLALVSGQHIRDFNNNVWENQSPGSINVLQWSGWRGYPTQRMDRQQIDLPASFLGETLTEIRLTDNGGWNRFDVPTNTSVQQRVFLAGVTVESGWPGDFNNDGIVDTADYVTWRKTNGTNTQLPNDPNPLPIDADQYNTWRTHFGSTNAGSGTGGNGNGSVPEPAVMIMVVLSACGLAFRRDACRTFAS